MTRSNSTLEVSCTSIKRTNFQIFFSNYFTKHVETHKYNTRNAQDYSINKSNKVFSDRAVRNCGPIFWNSLNNEIKRCKNTKEFRNSLKKHLLSNYS